MRGVSSYCRTMMTPTSQTPAGETPSLSKMRQDYFDSGEFFDELSELIAYPTESAEEGGHIALRGYLQDGIGPKLTDLGCSWKIFPNPEHESAPILIAHRFESPDFPTALVYGHADVVPGQAGHWNEGLSPWRLTADSGRWYGRGTAVVRRRRALRIALSPALPPRRARHLTCWRQEAARTTRSLINSTDIESLFNARS